MKLLFIIGDGAVGKMTVGQELTKITGLRLFHNHIAIEPVIEVFGTFNGAATNRLRDVFFEEFAKTDRYGMMFTYMWAFDMQSDWDYISHVMDVFKAEKPDTEFYFVELVAPQDERLRRNVTENRLAHKASKRDIDASNERVIRDSTNHRLVSNDGEIPFEKYIKIDNTHLAPDVVACMIKDRFAL